jgi:ABC-type nitrate/sulfonate/bicarbonate transport system substrate-binding protein
LGFAYYRRHNDDKGNSDMAAHLDSLRVRYAAARDRVLASDVSGWDCAHELAAYVSQAANGEGPEAMVSVVERIAEAADDFDAEVAQAERMVEVAASNFVLGYNAADAWLGAAVSLSS